MIIKSYSKIVIRTRMPHGIEHTQEVTMYACFCEKIYLPKNNSFIVISSCTIYRQRDDVDVPPRRENIISAAFPYTLNIFIPGKFTTFVDNLWMSNSK